MTGAQLRMCLSTRTRHARWGDCSWQRDQPSVAHASRPRTVVSLLLGFFALLVNRAAQGFSWSPLKSSTSWAQERNPHRWNAARPSFSRSNLRGEVARSALSMASGHMLHAMLHVRDANASIDFYRGCGMQVLSFAQRPNGAATVFMGFGSSRDVKHFALELSAASPKSKRGQEPIELGDGFQHMVFGRAQGFASDQALVDPDGYMVRESASVDCGDTFCDFCLRVSDLDASVQFYTSTLGMVAQPLETASAVKPGARCCSMRYSTDADDSFLPMSLTLIQEGPDPITLRDLLLTDIEPQGGRKITVGSGFDHFVISTPDVQAAAKTLVAAGVEITLPPTVMFGMNITGIRDLDGYSIYFVEEEGFRQSSPAQ